MDGVQAKIKARTQAPTPNKEKGNLTCNKVKTQKEIRKVLGPQGTNTLLKKLKETIAPLNKRHTSSIYQLL